ncbi:MAG: M24 family metallopeptidase [Halobacteriaceae archaeon]
MEKDLSQLREYLSEVDCDGYMIDAGSDNSDQLYISGFSAPDPFISLFTPDHLALLVSSLEYSRAQNESPADAVKRWGDYDYQEKRNETDRETARKAVLAEFLDEFSVSSISVPPRFPLRTADGLRERDISVTIDANDTVGDIRATKTETEIDHIRETQRANERAMQRAEELIREASVASDGTLQYKGEPLTSERVKQEIEVTLLRNSCALDETLVACGPETAEPHNRGSGPLHAHEPIVIDIFPQNKETDYHGDMTRTFVKGEPSSEIREFYETTKSAMDAAFTTLNTADDITGADVHDAVCNVYEEAGFQTLRQNENAETGFIHSTGHGVGLDVHESPSISPQGNTLEPGNVITIEPGLYDPDIGGVRIEDLLVVREDGFDNLNSYHKDLIINS